MTGPDCYSAAATHTRRPLSNLSASPSSSRKGLSRSSKTSTPPRRTVAILIGARHGMRDACCSDKLGVRIELTHIDGIIVSVPLESLPVTLENDGDHSHGRRRAQTERGRFTRTMPPSTSATATATPASSGSPMRKWPARTPINGVTKVKADISPAWYCRKSQYQTR